MRGFVLRLERGFGLLYDPRSHEYLRLGTDQVFLLLASQEIGIAAAVEMLAASAGRYEALVAQESLTRLGVLEDRFQGRVVELELPPGGGYSAPLAAHLGVTTACNFSCNHCYSSSGKRSPGELTAEECRSIIDQLAAIGCCKLVVGGGEPFLRKDLPELIAHARAREVDTFVHSNGTMLDRELLERLAACPPSGLTISLDGARAETNDRVRGEGTFAATSEAMERIRRHYPPGFAISMTITSANLDDTAAMVELAHAQGATILFLRPPFPAGNLVANDQLMVGLPAFWRALDAAHQRAKDLGVVLNAPRAGGPVLPTDFDGFGCIAAHLVLGITPQGEVTPCLNLPDDYVAGNVRESALIDLWRGGASFVSLRALEPNAECAACRHYEICRGGCRIRALHHSGRIDGPDSWCYAFAERGEDPPRRTPRLPVLAGP